jgi:transposase
LPSEFGPWPAIHQFFNRLSNDGYFGFLEDQQLSGHTAEAVFMDSTHCKVHQHSNGPGSPEDQAIGKSRGGLNTKIHLLVDVLGRLAAPIVVTSGNVSDITVAPVLQEDVVNTAAVGDKGYDSRELRDTLRGQDGEPCIPARSNVKNPEPCDAALYPARHVVENVFQRLKVFRRLATRLRKPYAFFRLYLRQTSRHLHGLQYLLANFDKP